MLNYFEEFPISVCGTRTSFFFSYMDLVTDWGFDVERSFEGKKKKTYERLQ